jgi:sacsin
LIGKEQLFLYLTWITECLKKNQKIPLNFVQSLRDNAWVQTLHNGLQRPSRCFLMDSLHLYALESRDVPVLDYEIYGRYILEYKNALQVLGVIVGVSSEDRKSAIFTVAAHLNDLSKKAARLVSRESVTRLYRYLQRNSCSTDWEPYSPVAAAFGGPRIWIPAFSSHGTHEASWVQPADCVIRDTTNALSKKLVPLERIYNQDREILQFFTERLKVSEVPGIESYCELWLEWTTTKHVVNRKECVEIWMKIALQHSNLQISSTHFWRKFCSQAWIPSVLAGDRSGASLQLTAPRDVFIPDDLSLAHMFATLAVQPRFMWFDNTEIGLEAASKLCSQIGVNNLSTSVRKLGVPLTTLTSRDCYEESSTGVRYVCDGLFRAILGYLSKNGVNIRKRHDLLCPLMATTEMTIKSSILRSYVLQTASAVFIEAKETVMAYWERERKLLYRLEFEDLKDLNVESRTNFCIQFVTTIAEGLLTQHPSLKVDGLRDFLLPLVAFNFELEFVDCVLRHKNMQIYPEDEEFLASAGL